MNVGGHDKAGFTIVELIIVIVVIAIMVSVVTIGMMMYQAQARDAERDAKTNVIAEALEKYYIDKGEYPSVKSMVNDDSSNTATKVASLINIEESNLKMPQSSRTLSIVSPSSTQTNVITYAGFGANSSRNTACQSMSTSAGCDRYTLSYVTESGDTVTINSRHN